MKRAVITGYGAVSPFGVGLPAWQRGLAQAESAVRQVSLFDANLPMPGCADVEPLSCQVAAEVPDFVAEGYLEPKDVDRVPRVVPLALCAAMEALDSAGLGAMNAAECSATGVLLGSGGGGFAFAEQQFKLWLGGKARQVSPYAISSSIPGMLSSEVSIRFGLKGRSHTISDGCTSSSDAMGYALDLIRNGRETRLLVGGADGCITPGMMAGFCLMRAMPTHWNHRPEGASRPFAVDRDGFVLGEGAWIFVVEELETARARGAHILAEICGYGATCEAYHRVALSHPGEAARAIGAALQDAGVPPEAVDYINLHGTGTAMNDPLETAAIKLAFQGHAGALAGSSTKSQIGHPQGASGAAGVAAILFAMQENLLPATINLSQPDPICDLDYVPNKPRRQRVQYAVANCLGFGSKNAALVLRNWCE